MGRFDLYSTGPDSKESEDNYVADTRLASASSSAAGTYELGYDALGRCVRRTSNGVASYYAYSGEHSILEYDGTGALLSYTLYGNGMDEAIMRSNNGVWQLLFQDRVGEHDRAGQHERPDHRTIPLRCLWHTGIPEQATGDRQPARDAATSRDLVQQQDFVYRAGVDGQIWGIENRGQSTYLDSENALGLASGGRPTA